MRGLAASRLGLAAVVLLAAGRVGGDEPSAAGGSFWGDVSRSGGPRYGALVGRAGELLERGDAAGAEPLLVEAVKLEPRDPLPHYLLGESRYRLHRWDVCADALLAARRLAPGYAPALSRKDGSSPPPIDDMLGLCLALSGRLDEAVAHYRRMLAAGPADPGAPGPPTANSLDALHGNLGDCYHALGRLDEAVSEYLAALAAAPRRAALQFALAVAYDRDERDERAREAMLRALQLDPQLGELTSPPNYFIPPSDIFYYTALAHEVAGESAPLRRALAIAWFRSYLGAVPRGPWVARAREHLAALGAAALGPGEVSVIPPESPEAGAVTRALISAGPGVQGCLDPGARAVVRASLAIPPEARGGAPQLPSVSLASVGPERASSQVLECIERKLVGTKIGVKQLTRVTLLVGGR